MESLIKDGVKYLIHNFQLENEFEKIVLSQSKLLFGENIIVFEKQKIRTSTGIGTIPDALIINPITNKWFVIEIELAIHNVYHHIIPQITKFKNALENEQTRKSLLKYFDSEIENDFNKLATWYSSTQNKSPHKHLSEIIDKEPELIIIIDGQNKELDIASKNLPFQTKINVFKTYTREGVGLGDSIYSFDLYAEPQRSNLATIHEVKTIQSFKQKIEKNKSNQTQEIIEKLSMIINSFDNVIVENKKSMMGFKYNSGKKGKSIVWLSPMKNYVDLYLTKGQYPDPYNIIRRNSWDYPVVKISMDSLESNSDYIKSLINIACNYAKKP